MGRRIAPTTPKELGMQIVIPIFDRFTILDADGPYQVLSQLPGAEVVFAAQRRGPVTDNDGAAQLNALASLDEVPRPDIVVIPGGPGVDDHVTGGPLQEWLVAADASSTWTTSVCTGALILAGAGLLAGRAATTNWLAKDEL